MGAFQIAVLAIMAGSTALQMYSTRQGYKAQQESIERQAEQERIAAETEELKRREKNNRILAANIVGSMDSGFSLEGTPSSIYLAAAEKTGLAEGLQSLNANLLQAQRRRERNMAGSVGRRQVFSQGLSGITDTALQYESFG